MKRLFGQIDALLRGKLTRREDLERGEVAVRAGTLVAACLVLGAGYGAFMGLFAAVRSVDRTVYQVLSSAVKVPLLFLLTLGVTLPSLYVFSTLAGSHLAFRQTLRLLLGGTAVTLALLASFGPITGFFTLSTESYPFMVVLNVLFFTAGGVAGLVFIARALEHVFGRAPLMPPSVPSPDFRAELEMPPPDAVPGPSAPPGARPRPAAPPPRPRSRALFVFHVWVFIYAVVGAQMGWILRPFVGSPELPFVLFRNRESNFFEALARTLRSLFGGG